LPKNFKRLGWHKGILAVVSQKWGTVAVVSPQDWEKAFIHGGIAYTLIAPVNVARFIYWMELSIRMNGV
jgi:hypothetical protein